jgi:hypothetical protein
VLPFLRSFKEAADHLNVIEGAVARILPSFLDGMAREGYLAHLDDAPDGIQLYPFMVQYLLETYAVDEALTEAYMAVTGARLSEGETEKAFGHRLYKLAIRAGNFIPKDDLRAIFIEGLPPFVRSGMRLHITPANSFEKAMRLAQDLGHSLRQAAAQSSGGKPPILGVKGFKTRVPRQGGVGVLRAECGDEDSGTPDEVSDVITRHELEVALASVRFQGAPPSPSGNSYWSPPPSSTVYSPPASVASIPSRGCSSPVGLVRVDPRNNAPAPETRGVTRPPLCFVCYQYGHFLTDFPRLPAVLQQETADNRAQYQPRRQAGMAHTGVSGCRKPSRPFPTLVSPPAGLLPHGGRGK